MGYRNSPVIGDGGMLVEKGDNRKYVQHALEAWTLPEIDTSDAKAVEDRVLWYFQHCIESDMKPTVKGLCNALGICRNTLRTWYHGEFRDKAHHDIAVKAYDLLEELWEDYMLNGKINPVAGIFLGKNNFGYADSQEFVLKPGQSVDTLTEAEIAAKYKELPDE